MKNIDLENYVKWIINQIGSVTCILHVYYMYITCNKHVYYMYITCILHVINMYITCLLHVYSRTPIYFVTPVVCPV